ncbi:hypothetical protein LA66_08365 [Aureimonas altamirensis]|uniref:Uncharacterized protein n=1 Tax=Aureimonas altamirensis TaxID=370622 RepID=A0A0B1Q5E7_9HYPH|nr:hypothetical protein LA66_08365 [Aureimonas altamirensis]
MRVRDRLGFDRPVIRDSSSSEPGDCSSMTRSSSRFPLDRICAKDSVDVNHTFGSPGAGFSSPFATRMVRAFISS